MTPHAHTHKSKLKTTLMIVVPLLIGAAIIWYINRPKKRKGAEKASDAVKNTQAAQTIKAIDASQFPIQAGSKGDMVKQLQNALIAAYGSEALPKYGADGDFGSETTAALKKYGIPTRFNSQVDYDAAISKLKSVKSIAVNSSRADDLVSKWNSNQSLQIITTGARASLLGVSQDYAGAITPTGDDIGMASGFKYNRTDYQIVGATQNGYVLINVTTGPHAGLKKVLASEISLG
jgi:hypothetical protein